MTTPKQFNPAEWIIDRDGNTALSIRFKECLFCQQSLYQTVEVFDTYDRGKMLTLDRIIMCTELDETAYHEMLVHVPMFTDTPIRDVLVIGGGDGGTVRELVRHEQIEHITMVEIDKVVIKAAREFLPNISSAFEHPKLKLLIEDGIKFVRETADETFDLVLVDSSDPVGPAEGLFTQSFYQDVYRCLRPGGLVTVQSESPSFNRKVFVEINQCLQEIFGNEQVHPYLAFIPMYPSGMWSFTCASKQGNHPLHNFNRDRAVQFAQAQNLSYYNADIHQAAFCLPTKIQKALSDK